MKRGAIRALVIYAIIVLLFASYRAWEVHTAPIDCVDAENHGPDPDSTECRAAIVSAQEQRPEETRGAFLGSLMLGVLGLGTYGTLRLMMRTKHVRLVVNGERF